MQIDLSGVHQYLVPRDAADATDQFLREQGGRFHEGLVLWVGRHPPGDPATFLVTRAIVPEQRTGPISVQVPGPEVGKVCDEIAQANEVIGVQIHSHPGVALHTHTDDEGALVTLIGGLSIVVPDYGKVSVRQLGRCAVYRWRGEDWQGPLTPYESASSLRFTEGRH